MTIDHFSSFKVRIMVYTCDYLPISRSQPIRRKHNQGAKVIYWSEMLLKNCELKLFCSESECPQGGKHVSPGPTGPAIRPSHCLQWGQSGEAQIRTWGFTWFHMLSFDIWLILLQKKTSEGKENRLPLFFQVWRRLLAADFYLRFEKDTLKRMLYRMVKEIRKRKGELSTRTQNNDFCWKTFRIHNPLAKTSAYFLKISSRKNKTKDIYKLSSPQVACTCLKEKDVVSSPVYAWNWLCGLILPFPSPGFSFLI